LVDGVPAQFSFGQMEFARAGDYEFEAFQDTTAPLAWDVSEVAGQFYFTVRVTDAGNGTLATEVLCPTGEIAFENQFTPLQIASELNGAVALDLADPNLALRLSDLAGVFEYELTPLTPGAPMPVAPRASNTAAGLVGFGEVSWSLGDLGGDTSKTFRYKVTQVGSAPGVANDPDSAAGKEFAVTVSVGPGGAMSQVTDPAGMLFLFENTYSAQPGSATLEVRKVLDGRQLAAGEFAFALESGGDRQTAVNDADGRVVFPEPIVFASPGLQAATIWEVRGSEPNISYDQKTAVVNITARDNLQGQIVLEMDATEKALTFVNTFDTSAVPVPPEPKPPLPLTGTAAGYATGLAAALILAGAVLLIAWRRRTANLR
jgi:hypothetical protein